MVGQKRILRMQLIGCGVFVTLLGLGLISVGSEAISIAETGVRTVSAVILAFLGVAFAGFGGALWRLLTFRKRKTLETAKIIQEQLKEICEHSKRRLDKERENMNTALAAAIGGFRNLMDRYKYYGVESVGNQLIRQIEGRLTGLNQKYHALRLEAADRIEGALKAFFNNCRKSLDETAGASAKSLRDSAREIMSERTDTVADKLESVKQKSAEVKLRLENAENEMWNQIARRL